MTENNELTKQVSQRVFGSFPIFGILTIIFVVGKIMGKLTWPWIWILAPLWGPYLLVIVGTILVLAFALGCATVAVLLEK